MKEYINKIYNCDFLDIINDIPDNTFDLLILDPPYNISQENVDFDRSKLEKKSAKRETILKFDFGEWDKFESDGDYYRFIESMFRESFRVLKEGAWIYIFFAKEKMGIFDFYLCKKYDIKHKTIFTWIKTNPFPSKLTKKGKEQL